MPKSATRVLPSLVSSRFSGLMSRWITPCRWAYSRAWAASVAIRRASSTGSWRSRREPVAETLALDVRHGEPELARGLARVVDRQDVRVLQPGGELDLALEALGAQRAREIGVQHLERDRPVVPQVLGEEDGGHAAPPELALEPVAIRQAACKLLAQVSHSRL